MRQFESFQNKVAVPAFTRNSAWQTIALPFIDADAKLVSVEVSVQSAGPETVGVRPTGTTYADPIFDFVLSNPGYQTVIMRVDGSKQVDFKAPAGGVATFSITAQWGGDAVVAFGVDPPTTTGWEPALNGVWRDFDLTSLLPGGDQGNVEAVICYCYPNLNVVSGSPFSADARANGSTWNSQSPLNEADRFDTIVKVDDDDVIEVRENRTGKSGPRTSWVYFVGYVLRGEVDDGSGSFYQYHAIQEPVDDEVGIYAWQNYDVSGKTAINVASIYWRLQQVSFLYLPIFEDAREVGSADAVLEQHQQRYRPTGHPLEVDASKEVQHYLHSAGTASQSWIFGYLDLTALPPPGQATDPDPPDGATNIGTTQILSWTAGANADSHDVYFGTDPTPGAGEFQGNQPGVTFNPGALTLGETYYWRIDEVRVLGGTTTGVVWSFTVGIGPVPDEMFGSVRIKPALGGTVDVRPALGGSLDVEPALGGEVDVEPALGGDVDVKPALGGKVQITDEHTKR